MFAQIHDRTHSYEAALVAAAGMMGLAAVLFLALRTAPAAKPALAAA